ncbi:MAG: MOSC domain-containing protein [Hydrogenibacillus sp.]|nr:MOSC domain-containing protein [Hydrogenibacillus sp.]
METFQVRSINIGRVKTLARDGRVVHSAIEKRPVERPIYLTKNGFIDDEQGDRENHGGEDKAVCVYPKDHYVYWERWLGTPLPPSAFGENVTVVGLLETAAAIGDVFRLGEAIVQVAQPRRPCFKLELRYGRRQLPAKVRETAFTGFYMRVLEEGWVRPGDALVRIERDPAELTVERVMRATDARPPDSEAIRSIAAHPALAERYRRKLQDLLESFTS